MLQEHVEHQTHITSIEKRAKITINIQLLIILFHFSVKKRCKTSTTTQLMYLFRFLQKGYFQSPLMVFHQLEVMAFCQSQVMVFSESLSLDSF